MPMRCGSSMVLVTGTFLRAHWGRSWETRNNKIRVIGVSARTPRKHHVSIPATRHRQRSSRRRAKSCLRNPILKGNLNEILPSTDAHSGRVASTGPAAFETYYPDHTEDKIGSAQLEPSSPVSPAVAVPP